MILDLWGIISSQQYQLLIFPMAGVKTRRHSASKLSEFVGPAKEFLPSEVPTLRAIIQRGLLVRDRLLLEQGSAKTGIHTKDIIAELVPLISTQWQMSNAKFSPPVTIKGIVHNFFIFGQDSYFG